MFFLVGGLFGLLLPGLESVSYDFDSQTLNAAGEVVMERLAWLSAALVVGVFGIAFLGRYVMPRLAFMSGLTLAGEQEASQGFVAGLASDEMPDIGTRGVAETTLRPAGKVAIGDTYYDAVSAGTFIDRDTPIVVVAIDGHRIIVDTETEMETK